MEQVSSMYREKLKHSVNNPLANVTLSARKLCQVKTIQSQEFIMKIEDFFQLEVKF